MSVLICLFISSIILAIVRYKYKYRRFWKLIYEFKGDKTLPFLGNIHQYLSKSDEEIAQLLVKTYEKYGRTNFRLILGNLPLIGLCEPQDAEIVLGSNSELTKADVYYLIRPWLGDGLLMSTGSKWRARRKIITPTFHFSILKQFVTIFNSKANIFVEKLSSNCGRVLDINPFVIKFSLDVICESAMGINMNVQNNEDSTYVRSVKRLTQLIYDRIFSLRRTNWINKLTPRHYEETKLIKTMHEISNDIIRKRKSEMLGTKYISYGSNGATIITTNKEEKYVPFLDLLILSKNAEGESLPDDVIREEVDTFMFEGHDTTSSCISFAMYCLANNPEVQEIAFNEQLSIFYDDMDRDATYDDLQNMKYLEMVIKETLRMYPSVPFFGRRIENDITLTDGKIIPAGVSVIFTPFLVNKNPIFFPDPLKFDPERFSKENSAARHSCLYIPFSAGSRNCVGKRFAMLDIKSVLSKVIRNFRLSTAGDDYIPKLVIHTILKSKNGLSIILNKRDYSNTV